MNDSGRTWALVLAAGEGNRLRSLTTTASGIAIPKQFCSLRGGPSLLQEALLRARDVAPLERTCAIVAAQHRRWWEAPLRPLPTTNVIVQPANRGTANGILLPLLHILERDPESCIVILPSDHHVSEERVMRHFLKDAVQRARDNANEILLLGLEPDELDSELGYIVPGEECGATRRVVRFVEKPSLELARHLIAQGALWNAFIVVAKARALIDLYARHYPEILAEMRAALAEDAKAPQAPHAIAALYAALPSIDFSKDVLERSSSRLQVLAVPPCGWSDLGTPARVARTLSRVTDAPPHDFAFPFCHLLNLAEQHMQLENR